MNNAGIRIDPEVIMRHVRVLSEDIGVRLAGSPEEQQAADYVQGEMQRIGLQDIQQQPFTCKWFEIKKACMQVRFGDQWESVQMDAVAHTTSTNGVLEAELVYVETATDMILDGLDLQGKVALVHGTYGATSRMIRRFVEKQVAGVIWTDVRYTPDWNVGVGLPFTFLPIFTFPAASVPHPVEWQLVRRGADRVKLELDSVVECRQSQNVIGMLPGKSDTGGVIVTGHHDTVRNCKGAEDNAAGAAVALAVAEALRDAGLEKPIKFVSFGTEEQLSQGAFEFVDNPANRAEELDMVLNVDGQGCWAGENEIYVSGSPELHRYVGEQMEAHNYSGVIRDEPDGFSDHFPFICKGIPAGWFHRRNCAGGRWFHHSDFDNIDALSPKVLQACAELVADMALDIAGKAELPYERAFPEATKQAVKAVRDGWLEV